MVVELHTVMIYHVDPDRTPEILKTIGKDYDAKVLDPFLKNAVRDVCAQYALDALYTDQRVEVEGKLRTRLVADLEQRGFIIEQVMIQTPEMTPYMKQRIEAKIGAEQDAQKMEYVLKSKKLEADAKVIEAEGIAKAQAIIQKDLSHSYLVYLWIEALKTHQGAAIYIPTGGDGMPLFKQVVGQK